MHKACYGLDTTDFIFAYNSAGMIRASVLHTAKREKKSKTSHMASKTGYGTGKSINCFSLGNIRITGPFITLYVRFRPETRRNEESRAPCALLCSSSHRSVIVTAHILATDIKPRAFPSSPCGIPFGPLIACRHLAPHVSIYHGFHFGVLVIGWMCDTKLVQPVRIRWGGSQGGIILYEIKCGRV